MKLHSCFLVLLILTSFRVFGQNITRIKASQKWQGIPGLEQTNDGRIFISWYSGGDKEPSDGNTVYLCFSDDHGKTFTAPQPMAKPANNGRPFDPALWIDPEGKLWYIINRGNRITANHGVYARTCRNPDAKNPVWSREFRLNFNSPYAFRINKPTVLSTGEWILPVTHAVDSVYDWFAGQKQLQGVAISADKGKNWKLHGYVKAPYWALENMIIELKNGKLWMLTRTGAGYLWESFSDDRGKTWSDANASEIASPGARFFIRRLESGNFLLVNHYKFKGRSHLTAQISADDGKTWNEGLLLDERSSVSYPDGIQDKNGLIRIVYDRDRQGSGEILMAQFREEDVLAGKDVSGDVVLKQVISNLDKKKILPEGWDPKQAAGRVLQGLIKVTAPQVKGAHDASFIIQGDKSYILSMVNDEKPSENPAWPFIYVSLSIVDIKTLSVDTVMTMVRGEQIFKNTVLPPGACFVPRIIQAGVKTLRCFFTSEEPGKRQSQVWYIDFDTMKKKFADSIYPAKLKTRTGIADFQPDNFFKDAQADGFPKKPVDYGCYPFDFKYFDSKVYCVLNNYPGGQNALSVMNRGLTTFKLLGHYNRPYEFKLSESAVNRLPDKTWIAIVRQDTGKKNYVFTTSRDGKSWTVGEYRNCVPDGTNSKPTLDRFNGIYYLGWQESTKINDINRSVFNIDISEDGLNWERKYRFETDQSFQYPTFHEYNGEIWLTVTQGDTDSSRKERIMFGRLE